MVTKQKHFLDSLRQMVSKTEDNTCPTCEKVYEGDFCSSCNMDNQSPQKDNEQMTATAYLVDLVSNHKIKIPIPSCKVGRDEANDIVVSGDQSISRHHLTIMHEDDQYYIEDMTSRHGTFLNGSQIKTRETISDGDVVKIGVSLFWFVIENDAANDHEAGTTGEAAPKNIANFEQGHVTVRPDTQKEPSDPSTSTMNEIPVMANEQTLLDRLRLKTRSFDKSSLFAHAQSQPGTIAPQPSTDGSKSLSETQIVLPALEGLSVDKSYDSTLPLSEPQAPTESFAVPEADESSDSEPLLPVNPTISPPLKEDITSNLIGHGEIYDQLMNTDLTELTEKYNELKHKAEEAQKQMDKVAEQLNSIRSLGTSLIGGSDKALVDACNTVFTQLGWRVTANLQDSQELQLRLNDHLAIVRVIWTAEEPERSHLGQLSIAQTNLWCEQGKEPKGILVVSRLADKNNKIPDLTHADYGSELTAFAAHKNVCMLTSLQVLALYRDLILQNGDVTALREKIINSNGWLPGFTIKT